MSIPIHTIKVPNPFVEGGNGVYIVMGDPITMIDTGIATERAYQAVLDGLGEHDLAPTDIRRVVLTHKHIDHIGNAWRFQEASGAEVLIHESELDAVTDVDPDGQRYATLVASRLDEWHVPEEHRPARDAMTPPQWQIKSTRATPLVDGQKFDLGGEWAEVIHTPGHTRGSICLEWGRYLFTGDHVLPDVSPNIGGGDMRGRQLLRQYLESLDRLRTRFREREVTVFPGHGDPMTNNLLERCDRLTAHHQRRLTRIEKILERDGELTVFELAQRLFGQLSGFHIVLGCAEAYSHLEWLVEHGAVSDRNGRFAIA